MTPPCAANPEAFFPTTDTPLAEIQEAQVACSHCPIRRECMIRRRVMKDAYGIWGGRVFKKWDADDSKYAQDWTEEE